MEPLVETFLCFAMFVCEMVLVKTLGVAASRLKSLFLRHRRLQRFPVHGSTTLVDAREEVWSSDFRFLPILELRCGSNQQLDPPPSRWQACTPGPKRDQVGEASIKVGWHTTCNKPAYGRKQSCSSSRSQSGKELRHTRSSTRTSDNSLKQFHH